MAEEELKNDLDSFDDDEIGIGENFKKTKPGVSFGGLFFALVVVFLVILSFWVSFMVGKKVLTPKKHLAELDLPRMVEKAKKKKIESKLLLPEQKSPFSSSPAPTVKKAAPLVKAPAPIRKVVPVEVKKPAPVKKVVPAVVDKPAPVKKAAVKKAALKPAKKKKVVAAVKAVKEEAPAETVEVTDTYYKVRAFIADTKEEAADTVTRLNRDGIEAFKLPLSDGRYAVQTGAFKSRGNAVKLLEKIKGEGYSGAKIIE